MALLADLPACGRRGSERFLDSLSDSVVPAGVLDELYQCQPEKLLRLRPLLAGTQSPPGQPLIRDVREGVGRAVCRPAVGEAEIRQLVEEGQSIESINATELPEAPGRSATDGDEEMQPAAEVLLVGAAIEGAVVGSCTQPAVLRTAERRRLSSAFEGGGTGR